MSAGYRMEDLALGAFRLIADIYQAGQTWHWRAHVRDRETDRVLVAHSGAEESEQAARTAAAAWLKTTANNLKRETA